MEDIIKLNIYHLWPNVKKLKDNGYSQYDYIALGFELEFPTKTPDKMIYENFIFYTYLYVDFYDGEMKILFNQVAENSTGESYLCAMNTQKTTLNTKKSKKSPMMVDNYDKIVLNLSLDNIRPYEKNEISDFQDLMKSFIDDYIAPKLEEIKPFLIKNNIGFEERELKKFKKMVIDSTRKEFSTISINEKYPTKCKNINSGLLYYKLNHTIPINESIVKKIKI